MFTVQVAMQRYPEREGATGTCVFHYQLCPTVPMFSVTIEQEIVCLRLSHANQATISKDHPCVWIRSVLTNNLPITQPCPSPAPNNQDQMGTYLLQSEQRRDNYFSMFTIMLDKSHDFHFAPTRPCRLCRSRAAARAASIWGF